MSSKRDDRVSVYHSDCLDVLIMLEDNSIDAVVTDPPYAMAFRGHDWDTAHPDPEIWKHCLLDEQTAHLKAGGAIAPGSKGAGPRGNRVYGGQTKDRGPWSPYGDAGGASRFFPVFKYQGKAPASERPTAKAVEFAGGICGSGLPAVLRFG